ncbi:MAG: kelch repeat-containing protein [Polyangia bacterium]
MGLLRSLRLVRSGRLPLVASGFLALVSPGCKGNPGPGLKIQAVEPARDHTCLRGPDKISYPLVPLQDAGTLRVTVLRNDGARPQLVCDTTASWPDERPNLDLGADVPREQLTFFVELFAKDTGKRAFSGMLPGASTATADGGAGVLPMFAVGTWNCPTTVMGSPRAFHTATTLPSGEVLVFGGLEALRAYGPDWFGVINTAEVYNPTTLAFTDVTIPKIGAPKPRAFHHMAVISATAEKVRLLAYGGVSANLPGLPVLTTPDRASQFRLMPAYFADAGGVEILTYDVATRTLTAEAITGETARAAFAGGLALPGTGGVDAGLLVAGGVDFFPTRQNNHTPPAWTYVRSLLSYSPSGDGVQRASATLPFDLLQPSVTPLSAGTALLLGAKVPATSAEPLQMYAATVSGLPGAAQLGTPQGVQGSPTIGHTATRLADAGGKARVLLTGGFLMTTQPPPAPPQPPDPASTVRLYTIDDPAGAAAKVTLTAVSSVGSPACGDTSAERYRPAAYEAAAASWSGQRVLITGGSPRFTSGVCNDCQPQSGVEDNPQCVLNQAFLYDAETNQMKAVTPMARPRMGHVQALLRDGNILLTGGLVRSSGQVIEVTSAVSLYNTRTPETAAADPDDPVNAALTPEQQTNRRGGGLLNPCPRLK